MLKFYEPVQTFFHHENGLDHFERLTRHFLPEVNTYASSRTHLQTNIKEDDNSYRIEMALPGVEKKNIRIEHENGYLTVRVDPHEKADSQEKNEEELPHYDVREFDYHGASRTFRTGNRVDGDKITASYNQGLLVLRLPKKEEFVPRPARSISVE